MSDTVIKPPMLARASMLKSPTRAPAGYKQLCEFYGTGKDYENGHQ